MKSLRTRCCAVGSSLFRSNGRTLCFLLKFFILFALAPSTFGGLNINLHIYQYHDEFSSGCFVFPELRTKTLTVIADQRVVDALDLVSNRHSLLVFGNPGQTYFIETSTNLNAATWESSGTITLSNVVQSLEGKTNSAGQTYYRVRQ